jgi:RNA polymerase sigma-70 factor (ECF subfamily)
MESSFGGRTSATLLDRLKHDAADQAAWDEFVRRYGTLIYRWCRHWKLQEADAEDVTQTVLLKLAEKLRKFSYDPGRSFRAYLKTLAHYAWCDFLDGRKRPGAGSGDSSVREALYTVEARDDLVQHLKDEFDREILDEAMGRVRERVEPRTWEAFRLTALEALSGAAVAQRLGLKIATVYQARCKVQRMLQEEIARLEAT